MQLGPSHVVSRSVGARTRRTLMAVVVAWTVGTLAVPTLGAQEEYVATLCPGKQVEAIPERGPAFSQTEDRIIYRADALMMQDLGGVDVPRMDSNWSQLTCNMTFSEVDSLVNIVYNVGTLTSQGSTREIVLVLDERQLVFQDSRLVRALGPTAIRLPE